MELVERKFYDNESQEGGGYEQGNHYAKPK